MGWSVSWLKSLKFHQQALRHEKITVKDSIKEFKYQILNLIHSPTSAMYLFGSGSLNSALNNDNIFGEAVFNMSMNSGSKFPSQYTPLNHFSVVLQTSEEKV